MRKEEAMDKKQLIITTTGAVIGLVLALLLLTLGFLNTLLVLAFAVIGGYLASKLGKLEINKEAISKIFQSKH